MKYAIIFVIFQILRMKYAIIFVIFQILRMKYAITFVNFTTPKTIFATKFMSKGIQLEHRKNYILNTMNKILAVSFSNYFLKYCSVKRIRYYQFALEICRYCDKGREMYIRWMINKRNCLLHKWKL